MGSNQRFKYSHGPMMAKHLLCAENCVQGFSRAKQGDLVLAPKELTI